MGRLSRNRTLFALQKVISAFDNSKFFIVDTVGNVTSNASHASTMLNPMTFRTRDARSRKRQQRESEQPVNDLIISKMVYTFRKYLKTTEVIKGEQKLSPMKEAELSNAFSSASLLAEIDVTDKAQLNSKKNECFDYNGNKEKFIEDNHAIQNSET
jgi:hypothetical protein